MLYIKHMGRPSEILLVDLHNTLSDFNLGFEEALRQKYPEIPVIPLQDRRHQRVLDEYPPEVADKVLRVYATEGFVRNLPIVSGAAEALRELDQRFHVFICTSYSTTNPYANLEKNQWIKERLGLKWVERTIVTDDKTMIRGNMLIDDSPRLKGLLSPKWEHIVFDLPYNRFEEDGRRRLNWHNWFDILLT